MTNTHSEEQPVDVATIARDDMLLDSLARDEPPNGDGPAGDKLALMFAAWRTDLAEDLPEDLPTEESEAAKLGAVLRSAASPSGRTSELSSDLTARRISAQRRRRPNRVLLIAAAAVVALAGATTIAAGNAGPDSPLWPITKIVYADQAESILAQQETERTIVRAREAISEARYADAARLLDEATVLAGLVRDQSVARRLLDEIAAVRGLLPGGGVVTPPLPSAGQSPGPGGVLPTGVPGAGPGPAPSGGLPLPPLPLPPLPLPSAPLPPLPVPSLPLPPLPTTLVPLPTLPLPPLPLGG